MAKLSEKYIAGFLDSDGSIQILWRPLDRKDSDPTMRRPYLSLEWTQINLRNEVLVNIQETIGGKISIRDATKSSTLKLFGKPAVKVLNRIKKYLVVKKHYAEVVLDILGTPHKIEPTVAFLKIHRKQLGKIPNYPSGKWLAGYFDGDGSLQCRIGKGRNSGQIVAQITSSLYDSEGVKLIHKAFGGSLCKKKPGNTDLITWTLTMPPSKAKQFLGYIAKHMIVKKDQAYFILGCAKMGHYRDGKSIKLALKQLKAQPHRLSELEDILSTIKDFEIDRSEIGRRAMQNRWYNT